MTSQSYVVIKRTASVLGAGQEFLGEERRECSCKGTVLTGFVLRKAKVIWSGLAEHQGDRGTEF